MSVEKPKTSALKRVAKYALPVALGAFAVFMARHHLAVITGIGYFLSSFGFYHYHQNPLYLSYLKGQWNKLEEIDPMPFPEIVAENFTKELLWEVTNNLDGPVVIRGAFANNTAVGEWGKEFFLTHYPETEVLAKQKNGKMSFKTVRTTMRKYWEALEDGINVSIVASSSLFAKHPELLNQVSAPFDNDIVTPDGKRVFLSQLFVTPGARTFHHSEVGGNVFRQISGRKRWTMIAYDATKYMCPYFVTGSALVKSCAQGFGREMSEAWYKRLHRMETILEPGDILYNPPWGWHDVEAVSNDTLQSSIAGRMYNINASLRIAPLRSIKIIFDRFAARLFGYGNFPSGNWLQTVEDRLVESWTAECVADGFDNCFALHKPTPEEL